MSRTSNRMIRWTLPIFLPQDCKWMLDNYNSQPFLKEADFYSERDAPGHSRVMRDALALVPNTKKHVKKTADRQEDCGWLSSKPSDAGTLFTASLGWTYCIIPAFMSKHSLRDVRLAGWHHSGMMLDVFFDLPHRSCVLGNGRRIEWDQSSLARRTTDGRWLTCAVTFHGKDCWTRWSQAEYCLSIPRGSISKAPH